jgi:hypothetical protein
MSAARRWVERLPWAGVLLVCATLGLAPFNPPHVVEKLGMLARGQLSRPIDVFDLFLHGTPWLLLVARAAVAFRPRPGA